jgi:hypothetical protein
MKKNLIYILLISLCACQEEVVLDLKQQSPIPVIEGIWTDQAGINQVTVSLSTDYYDPTSTQPVPNAEVAIYNVRNNEKFDFRYSSQSRKYFPLSTRVARVGETYELHVTIGNKTYTSVGKMLEPAVLDSVLYSYREGTTLREEGYYLKVFGKIPFTTDNNYRVRLVRNDTILNNRTDYLLFDDTFGTSLLNAGFELTGFAFQRNDKVKIEFYRLNQDAYDYLTQLVNLLFNDGGLFSPPPQNPDSNIRAIDGNNEVLGYFMVSPYLSRSLIISD